MKRCPVCNRTYTDDTQLFCLEDGTQLMPAAYGSDASSSFDPGATLAYTPARETNPPPENFYPQPPVPQHPAPTWGPSPYTPAPQPVSRHGSKAWIIGAVVTVIVLGIGIVVLLAIIGTNSTEDENKNSNRAVVADANVNNDRSPGNTNNSNREPSRSNVLKDDFSSENWPTGERAFGSYYQDGEYYMIGKPKLYVYMFPLSKSSTVDVGKYATRDATIKVTTRSVDGISPEYGYGLIVHGKTNAKGKLEGYGFLLYTGPTPKYEIVRFVDGLPTNMVDWTASNTIRGGTNSNQIEVRASGSQLSMYVNGQYLNSVTDTANITDGFVGLYTSEANEVAFDDMEIERNASGLTP